MEKNFIAAFFLLFSLVSCTDKINYDIDNPDETANVVMVYRQPTFTDSVFLGINGRNVRIEWGDGTIDSFPNLRIASGEIEQNAPHKYNAAKDYVIKISADDLTLLAANYLTQINVDRATQLKQLHIPGSFLRKLDLSSNTLLEDLLATSSGELGKLDLSSNTLLKEARVSICELRELNIKGCNKLEYIECGNNRLNELDLSGNTALRVISFNYNYLTKIDVSQNPSLVQVGGTNNRLTEIDLSFCHGMDQINLDGNALNKLVMPTSQKLHTLTLMDNKLSSIDLSNNPKLTVLYLNNNNFSELDISNNKELSNVDISNNQFSWTSLNNIFTDLSLLYSRAWIRITANPGTNQCDKTIASAKNWEVRTN